MSDSQPLPVSLLLALNKCFKLPVHPFNTQADGGMRYSEWQFEKGAQTIAYFLTKFTADGMFNGKTVLDVGCGAAGKSLYYITLGARRVVGLDTIESYRGEASDLARRKGLESRFEYVCADAADTGFADAAFDTVIINDAMEHVAKPGAVLRECLRVLAPGGRIYLNFPPYYHPYGAHLSDVIAIPWVHAFFSEKTMIAAYKRLVSGLSDGDERLTFRMAQDGQHIAYINHMTIRRFKQLLRELPANCIYYHEEPLRGFLRPLSRIPGFREFFVKMVVSVIEPAT